MSWARLDDRFHSDPRILRVGNAATGLYARSIAFVAANMTDGAVELAWAKTNGKPSEIKALVNAGLWAEEKDEKEKVTGYGIVKYLTFNMSKAEIEEKRRQNADRQRRWREEHREPESGQFDTSSNGGSNASHNGAHNTAPYPNPSQTQEDLEKEPPQNQLLKEGWTEKDRAIADLVAQYGGDEEHRQRLTRLRVSAHEYDRVRSEYNAHRATVTNPPGWCYDRLKKLEQKRVDRDEEAENKRRLREYEANAIRSVA